MALRDKVSDISCDKQTDIQNYINAFDINEGSIDFETLSNYDDSSYVLNAYNLNNLNNNINNMQDNWNDNVNNYLDDKAELFQSWIDNLGKDIRPWNNDLYYYKNDIVSYSEDIGAIFLCLQNCDGSQPLPTASSVVNDYWLRIYNKGDKGLDSYDLNYIGEFNWEWEAFLVNDVVYVNNNDTIDFYVCISNVSYSSVNTPENDTEHWICLFVIHKDGLMIYDEMPNQDFFDNPNSPSIFGVVSPTGSSTVKFIDRINSESASNPQYLDVRQLMNTSKLAITSTYTSSISNAIKELIQQHNLLNIFNIAM